MKLYDEAFIDPFFLGNIELEHTNNHETKEDEDIPAADHVTASSRDVKEGKKGRPNFSTVTDLTIAGQDKDTIKEDLGVFQPPHQNYDKDEGLTTIKYGVGRARHQAEARASSDSKSKKDRRQPRKQQCS